VAVTVRHALFETALDKIRADIVSGRYKPGQRLVEDRLAQELGISRNPVREALKALEVEGFVELNPGRGASVVAISLDEADEIFVVRESLESTAARLAAKNLGGSQLGELEAVLKRGTKAANAGRIKELPDLNTEFHRLLVIASGNSNLLKVWTMIRDKMEFVYSIHVERRGLSSWGEHAAILEAVKTGDPELAALLAGRHISNAQAAFSAGAD
jgi:DNA-binding GntR family transcriptional regulator